MGDRLATTDMGRVTHRQDIQNNVPVAYGEPLLVTVAQKTTR